MKKITNIIGMALGAFVVILGLIMTFGSGSIYYVNIAPLDYSFGADFYTEMYSVTRETAMSVMDLGSLVEECFSFLLIMIGLFVMAFGGIVICYFAGKFFDTKITCQNVASNSNSPENDTTLNAATEEIFKYKELLDMGAISEEEFDKRKNDLLNETESVESTTTPLL